MKIKIIIALLCATAACSAFAQGLLRSDNKQVIGSNNILAVVEDRVITRAEVMKEVEPFIPQIRAAARSELEFTSRVNSYVREIVQNMVDRELIVKEFKAKGMTIPQSYLDTHFDDYVTKEFNGDRAEFIKFIQSQGKTIKQFRAEQEKDIIVSYMQGQKRQSVSEISPAKIKEYYDANKSKWYSPASVKIRLITLKTGMYATLDENKKLAAEIMERIKKGEDFAELAKRFSKDDSSVKGGEWGWYKKGELSPILDKKVFALKVGEVTEPTEIGDMIFILKVEEKKEDGIQSIDDVREQIEWTIVEQNGKAIFQKWLEGLRRNAFVKYYE
jgi:ppiC-type peptidyl-prolyl cis-trans isomerase